MKCHLLLWVFIGPRIKPQKDEVPDKLEVWLKASHPMAAAKGGRHWYVRESVEEHEEGTGEGVLLLLSLHLLQLHLRGRGMGGRRKGRGTETVRW